MTVEFRPCCKNSGRTKSTSQYMTSYCPLVVSNMNSGFYQFFLAIFCLLHFTFLLVSFIRQLMVGQCSEGFQSNQQTPKLFFKSLIFILSVSFGQTARLRGTNTYPRTKVPCSQTELRSMRFSTFYHTAVTMPHMKYT